jgi:hypothetical protein
MYDAKKYTLEFVKISFLSSEKTQLNKKEIKKRTVSGLKNQ